MQGNVSKIIVEAMKKRNITLERLEAASGISERHIMAIIESNRKNLPAAPYLRGYLLKIGKMLDINGEELWREYIAEGNIIRQSGKEDKLPEGASRKKQGKLKLVFIGIVVAALAIFAGTRFLGADNPNMQFENLEEGITETKERIFVIHGTANPKFKITLGREEVVLKENGRFEKEVIVEPGFNTFLFVAKKPLGKEHKFPKQIFYEEKLQEERILLPGEIDREPQGAPSRAPEIPEVIQ